MELQGGEVGLEKQNPKKEKKNCLRIATTFVFHFARFSAFELELKVNSSDANISCFTNKYLRDLHFPWIENLFFGVSMEH